MKRWMRSMAMAMVLATSVGAVTVVAPTAAHAQVATLYAEDLGVLLGYSSLGFEVMAIRQAARARALGLQRGDIIVAIDDRRPRSLEQLRDVLFSGGDEEDHDLDLLRDGEHLHLTVFHVDGRIFVHTNER